MSDRAHRSQAEIRSLQLEALRSLVAALQPGNRFYTRKLQAAGVSGDVASLADFSARFPFTTKAELVADQAAAPPFGSNLTYPLARYTRCHQTSGTSGQPLRWLDTPESWEWLVENWAEVYRAAGVGVGDRVYFAFSFGPFLGFWTAFESAERLGCLCLPGGGASSSARLRAILDHGATVLCCTPTYALRLGDVAAAEQLDLSHSQVRRIIVAGEPGGSLPATRARLEELWPGARVFDHHGMTEVGPVTYECPARPGVLHVLETGHYAEVINPATLQPAVAGEAGELVLTPLGRTASPLLRYRTGDWVKCEVREPQSEAPCACGRCELALPGGILGRVDDMVIVRGVNLYPSAVDEVLRSAGGVAEYQVRLDRSGALTELCLTVEPQAAVTDLAAWLGQIERAFDRALGLRVRLTTAPVGSLPRSEMKAARGWTRG